VPGAGSAIRDTVDDLAFRLEHWAAAGSRVFFPAGDAATGEELWVSDGTAAGTCLLMDILPGARSSEIRWLTAVAGHALFVADDGVHGRELWVSDGTAAGTHLVFDLVPGAGSSLPEHLLAVSQGLVFSAWRPSEGRELWYVDRDGLFMRVMSDIAPGGESSSPQELTLSGSRVDFVATDASTGFELYSIPASRVDGSTDFFTVTPCRLVDTRETGGALSPETPRRVQTAGPCGIPATARAVAVNVTVTGATGAGHLLLYRDGIQPPATTVLNFTTGATRANNAIVEIGQGGILARASLTGTVHVIVDVTGYFE
jgi:ELWxxDGT repeat protein